MSKISKDGLEQIKIIRRALDSIYDKLESEGVFSKVQDEFEAIADIISRVETWEEA